MQLSLDLIEEWIKNNPRASICTSEGIHAFKNIASFQDYHGLPEFRNVCYVHLIIINRKNKTIYLFFFSNLLLSLSL